MPDSWNRWQERVLSELEENRRDHNKLFDALTECKIELAMLKVKSGVWGAVAGFIPVAIVSVWFLLSGC